MRSITGAEIFPAQTPAVSQVFTTVLSHGPLTRLEAGRRAQLSPAAVTKAVRPLLEAGYLLEDADEDSRPAVGRPATLVRVNGARALFAGVKVTGDKLIGVLTDLCCRVRLARRVPLPDPSPRAVLAALAALVRELIDETRDLGPAVGLGIAVSGDVDRAEGIVTYSPFLGWRDLPLAELASAATGLPVTVDNDVRALTAAEQWFGAGAGLDSFAVVTVGTGIGCGLVVHGRVVSGAHGVAGEIGHVVVDPAGPACPCGSRGCVEAVAGEAAILTAMRAATGRPVPDSAAAADLARQGVPGAREVYERAGTAIGRGIAAVANLLGPERVVISGEGLTAHDLFAGHVRRAFTEAAFGSAARCDVRFRPLPFEEWARGASAAAIRSFITSAPGSGKG
ncbi:ROK family protein [Streptomyces sp. J2-1]|uniref:ROK family protein n=1 Tax=Streptomyces corallincola TaxID=2851888 RepID=UPI001C392410|nr:ROK family protein [Streptomyces corallincola]MBV2353025.1 ROK family protein [Streptomyces corallincola]